MNNGTALADLEKRINNLYDNINQKLDYRDKILENLDTEKKKIIKAIFDMKLKIIEHFDRLEKKAFAKLDKNYKVCHDSLIDSIRKSQSSSRSVI